MTRPETAGPEGEVRFAYLLMTHRDAAHVARYDLKEDASAAGEVALLEAMGIARDSLVLEFGAGTGQFTVAVAPMCARVIALDISAPMLKRLRAK